MGWFRRQRLRHALKKEWNPNVKFDIDEWGFVITLINPTPVKSILDDGYITWNEISKLAFEATEEILKFIQYEISDKSLNKVKEGVTINDTNTISDNETRDLLHSIWVYEEKFNMSVKEWYIDYILTCGHKYI